MGMISGDASVWGSLLTNFAPAVIVNLGAPRRLQPVCQDISLQQIAAFVQKLPKTSLRREPQTSRLQPQKTATHLVESTADLAKAQSPSATAL